MLSNIELERVFVKLQADNRQIVGAFKGVEASLASLQGKFDRAQKTVSKTMGEVEKSTKQVEKSAKQTSLTLDKMRQAAVNAVGGFAGLYIVRTIAREFIRANVAFDSLEFSMRQIYGSAGQAAVALDRIRATADRFGLEILPAAQSFNKLAAAAKGTVLEGEGVVKVFDAVAVAGAAMQLSTFDLNNSIFALTQMISKGRVQTEELRRQLGERLPGAFEAAARAMGVTTFELNRMLENGELISSEFLPKFAEELQRTFGQGIGHVNTMRANMARLTNAVVELFREIGETGVWAEFVDSVVEATEAIKSLGDQIAFLNDQSAQVGETLSNIFPAEFMNRLSTAIALWERYGAALENIRKFGHVGVLIDLKNALFALLKKGDTSDDMAALSASIEAFADSLTELGNRPPIQELEKMRDEINNQIGFLEQQQALFKQIGGEGVPEYDAAVTAVNEKLESSR